MINKQRIELIGFVFSQTNLAKLANSLPENYKNIKFNVFFDGVQEIYDLTTKEFEEYTFENRKITSINFVARDPNNYENKVCLEKVLFSDYELSFESNDDTEYSKLKKCVDDWIKTNQKRKCVSFIHSIWFVLLIAAFLIVPLLFLDKEGLKLDSLISFYFILGFLMGLISFGLCSLLKYMLPKVEIAIGINHHKTIRKCLSWIFLSLIVPIIMAFLF